MRFMLEAVGPELRQYIVTDNNEERPFSRDQPRWVYASSKLSNRYFGCRNHDGTFSLPRLIDQVAATPSIRAIEIKLSQGADGAAGQAVRL